MSRSAISDSSERIHDSDTLRNAEQPAENAQRRVEITGSKPQIPDNLRLLSVARSRLHLIRARMILRRHRILPPQSASTFLYDVSGSQTAGRYIDGLNLEGSSSNTESEDSQLT